MTEDIAANILIVDDLPENLLALEALIRTEGCKIYQAQSGEEALALLLKYDFALAILDVQMPGMTGFELADLMRGTDKTRHIPIVFVTAASRETGYSFKGYENGAVDFLYKPLDGSSVKSKVSVFVDLFLHRQEIKQQVAELKEAREQQQVLLSVLQTTKQELQGALQMRDEFMSMVAHELRTPLGVLSLDVQTRLQHLAAGTPGYFDAENMATMLAKDRRQVKSMTRLIEDMLDVSRIQNGKLSIRATRVNLSKLLERLVADFSQLDETRVILLNAPPGVEGWWDEFRLEQIVVNLLTNALRYGIGQPIEVTLTKSPKLAHISVRDHGIGIPKEDQQRIFDRFVRVNNKTVSNGLGLGLYVTKHLVEAHGGSIAVESREGEGSVFTVVLPLGLD
jgi:signal transduction histidine kinase